MSYSNRIYLFIMVFFLFFICIPKNSFSQDKVGTEAMPYLKFINSPTAAAMGNCAINLTKEESALYNPGAFGLLFLKNNLSISMPNNSIRLPNFMYLKSLSIGVGINLNQAYAKNISNFNLAISAAYSKFRLLSKITQTVDYSPYTIQEFDYYEIADYYSFAIAFDYFVKIGIGLTHKNIRTDNHEYIIKANCLDYGILIEFPLMDIIYNNHSNLPTDNRKINFEYTPSFGYVKANIGDDILYPYNNHFPLPKFSRTGWALYMAANSGTSPILEVKLVMQTERNLIFEVNDFNNFGHEMGFLGAVFYRWGRAEYTRDTKYFKTSGYGINSQGIVKWLLRIGILPPDRLLQNINNNLEISFSHSKYWDDDYGFMDNVKSNKLNILYSF